MARPPLQAARQAAIAALINKHRDEYDNLVGEELAQRGWHQEEVTRQKWVQQPAKPAG